MSPSLRSWWIPTGRARGPRARRFARPRLEWLRARIAPAGFDTLGTAPHAGVRFHARGPRHADVVHCQQRGPVRRHAPGRRGGCRRGADAAGRDAETGVADLRLLGEGADAAGGSAGAEPRADVFLDGGRHLLRRRLERRRPALRPENRGQRQRRDHDRHLHARPDTRSRRRPSRRRTARFSRRSLSPSTQT